MGILLLIATFIALAYVSMNFSTHLRHENDELTRKIENLGGNSYSWNAGRV